MKMIQKILATGAILLLVAAADKPPKEQTTMTSLDIKDQKIVSIAANTAVGNMEQLKVELNDALDAGLSVNQIKETLVHLYAYCGFPRSLNAINAFRYLLEERAAKGIKDTIGQESEPIKETGKYQRGLKTLEALTGTPQKSPAPGYGEFAPRIDQFLKEHLFADIFDSEVLTYRQRELATIGALASSNGLGAQLAGHLAIGLNIGITESQLNDVMTVVEKNIGKQQADSSRDVLKNVLNR